MVLDRLKFIRENPSNPDSIRFKQMHKQWKKEAIRQSKQLRNHLIEIECVRIYGINHPEKSAKMIKDECALSLSTRHICNIIHDEKV